MQILQGKMKASDPHENQIYKFLGCKQAVGIDIKKVMEIIQIQMNQRTRKLVGERLYDKHLVKAINCRVISVAAFIMNLCNFTGLDQLDKRIKRILRENSMHGKQCSDERLYLRREFEQRETKSLKDVYAETKVRVACYMTFSSSV